MKAVVVDTDIFIDDLRGLPVAKNFFQRIRHQRLPVYFSAVTEGELISGSECSIISKRALVLDLLSIATKMPVSNAIAMTAGDFRRKYGVKLLDCIIAATAYHAKADLMTRNLSEFSKIREINSVKPY